jgi:hypothetical protein
MSDKTKKVTQEELTKLQELHNSFVQAKVSLGDVELQKQNILEGIKQIRTMFSEMEEQLKETYGDNSVVNLETGEVTEKKE